MSYYSYGTTTGGTSSNLGGYSKICGGTHEWLPCEICGASIKILHSPSTYTHICKDLTKELYEKQQLHYTKVMMYDKERAERFVGQDICYPYWVHKNPNSGRSYKQIDYEWVSNLSYDEWVRWGKGEIRDSVEQANHIKQLEYRVKNGKDAQEELDKLKK